MSDKPSFTFDYGQGGNLTEAVLQESQEVLAMAGKSQRPLVERVRALHLNRGADSSFKQVLKIVIDYVDIYPLDFEEMVRVLGGFDQAIQYVPGVMPPPVVWKTRDRLREEGAVDSIRDGFWSAILDIIESGEMNEWRYVSECQRWIYTMRGLRPGYKISNSKAVVPVRKSA
jgi:hypothetical protein